MQRIWRPSASARSCAPTARAVCPPMPASTSSKTSVASPPSWATPMQREHHARELAAGGDLAQRAGGNAGVGGDEELDGVGTRRARPRARPARSRRSRPPSPARRAARATAPAEPRRGLRPRGAQRAREPSPARHAPPRARARAALERDLGAGELVAALAAALGVREHRGDRCRRACASGGRARRGAPRSPPVRPGSRLEPLGVARAARRRGPRPRSTQRAPALGQRVERAGRRPPRRRARARPAASSAATPGAVVGRERLRPPPSAAARSASRWRRRSRSASSSRSSSCVGLEPPRSPAARRRAGRARAHARRRARAAPRAPPRARAPARGPRRTPRGARACAAPQKASRISSCAEASMSLRCSCWP